ncbi:MFS transporter [Candidatus Bipolaricaulota bacterium]|nr:MFS transporter [Candidatus Bipolaricaulota bacterium]
MRARGGSYTLGGYFSAFVGLGLTAASVGPTLPSLAAIADVRLAQIGLLLFARSFGEMIGCLVSGSIVDRGYERSLLALSILLLTTCLAMVPFSRSLLLLATVFWTLGAAQGAVHTGINTLLVWKHPHRAHSLLSVLHFMFAAGMVVAPLIIAWLLPIRADGLSIYWVLAIALVPVALWLATSTPSSSTPVSIQSAQSRPLPRVALVWAIGMFFFYVGAEINVGAWLYTYASQAAQFAPATAAYLVATFWGAFMLGRLLAIFASAVISPFQYVCGGLLTGLASAVGIVMFAPQAGPGFWISIAALGVSMAAVFPQAFAMVSKALGMSGRRAATLLVAGSFGGMLLPWLTGQLMESISPHSLPIMVGISMILAFIAFFGVRHTASLSHAGTPDN